MVWKFDFRSSGLVVDTVQATVEIVRSQNGIVLLSISNDEDEPRENSLEQGEHDYNFMIAMALNEGKCPSKGAS